MRVFTQKDLKNCSRIDLERKLNMVKGSIDLSRKERDLNVAELEVALNGGVRNHMSKVILEIDASKADAGDIGD